MAGPAIQRNDIFFKLLILHKFEKAPGKTRQTRIARV